MHAVLPRQHFHGHARGAQALEERDAERPARARVPAGDGGGQLSGVSHQHGDAGAERQRLQRGGLCSLGGLVDQGQGEAAALGGAREGRAGGGAEGGEDELGAVDEGGLEGVAQGAREVAAAAPAARAAKAAKAAAAPSSPASPSPLLPVHVRLDDLKPPRVLGDARLALQGAHQLGHGRVVLVPRDGGRLGLGHAGAAAALAALAAPGRRPRRAEERLSARAGLRRQPGRRGAAAPREARGLAPVERQLVAQARARVGPLAGGQAEQARRGGLGADAPRSFRDGGLGSDAQHGRAVDPPARVDKPLAAHDAVEHLVGGAVGGRADEDARAQGPAARQERRRGRGRRRRRRRRRLGAPPGAAAAAAAVLLLLLVMVVAPPRQLQPQLVPHLPVLQLGRQLVRGREHVGRRLAVAGRRPAAATAAAAPAPARHDRQR